MKTYVEWRFSAIKFFTLTLKDKIFSVRALNAYRGSIGIPHLLLTSTLDRGEWLVSRPSRFILGERTPDRPVRSLDTGTKWV
jgi:hypothetical protein